MLISVESEGFSEVSAVVHTLVRDESGVADEGDPIAPLFVQAWELNDKAAVMSSSMLFEGSFAGTIAAKLMSSTVPSFSKHRSLLLKGEDSSDVVTGEISSAETSDILDSSVGTVSSEDSASIDRRPIKVLPGLTVVGGACRSWRDSKLFVFGQSVSMASPEFDDAARFAS